MSESEPINNAIIKADETLIKSSNSNEPPPFCPSHKPNENGVAYDKKRNTYFCIDKKGRWRYVPKWAGKTHNPFLDYKPVEPCTRHDCVKKNGKASRIFLDANKVPVFYKTENQLCPILKKYPLFVSAFEVISKTKHGVRKNLGNLKVTERLGRFLFCDLQEMDNFKLFFNEHGQPKPELIFKLYMAIVELILSRPEVVATYWNAIYKETLDDPVAVMERIAKLRQIPTPIFNVDINGGNAGTKINLFVQDKEPEPTKQEPEIIDIKSEILPNE